MLGLVQSPALLLPLVGLVAALMVSLLKIPLLQRLALMLLLPLVVSLIYSPIATQALSTWLQAQLPVTASLSPRPSVVVLVGRGPAIAAATTAVAASELSRHPGAVAYVSGDKRSTAERLQQRGVAPARIAGDSCARTTWENASLTAAWLQEHHPDAPVLLITDPWQLPRAAHAFGRQGLRVQPLAAEPALTAEARNRIALRETAATLLYRLQGRM